MEWIIMGAVLCVGVGVYFHIRHKVRNVSRQVFGTEDLIAGLQQAELEAQETPKSVGGMERLLRPTWERDFPEMSLEELKTRNEDELYALYAAMDKQDSRHFADMGQVNSQVDSLVRDHQNTRFRGVTVHAQALQDYRKDNGTAVLTFRAAVESIQTSSQFPNGKKVQSRWETQWVFVLENRASFEGGAVSLNCPHCGGVVENPSVQTCAFCGSHIKLDYTKAWQLNSIKEC